MMANTYTIDKMDPETRRDLISDLLSDQPVNRIANNYGLPVSCVRRYKEDKLFMDVAEVWAERKENTVADYERQLSIIQDRLNKALEAVDLELLDPRTGKYDLSNPQRAGYYMKILNDTSKSLQTNLLTLAKISENIREVEEASPNKKANKEFLLAIVHVFQQVDIPEEYKHKMIMALSEIRDDIRQKESQTNI